MFIATELSGQQGGSSGAKECLDIPCGYSGPATKVDPYSLVGGRLGSVTMLSSPATFSDQFRNKRVSPGWVVSPPQDSRLVGLPPHSIPTCWGLCLSGT